MKFIAALSVLGLTATAAHAEPVWIDAPGGATGQGWVFERAGECMVVTAAHVAARGAIVTDSKGSQGVATRIIAHPQAQAEAGEGVDLAVMFVDGKLASACPASSLGYSDLSPTLERVRTQNLPIALEQSAGGTGIVTKGARLLAINSDGQSFTLELVNQDGGVAQGESGSPVRLQGSSMSDAGLPIGIVVSDYGGGIVKVMRFARITNFPSCLLANS